LLYPLFREDLDRLMQTYEHKTAPYLFRLSRDLDSGFSILDAVSSCRIPEKFYFSAKDDPFILAGLESALTVEAPTIHDLLPQIGNIWEADATVPLFGGFSFDEDDRPSPEWQRFGRCRFTLPFVEFRRNSGGSRVSLNYVTSRKLPVSQVLREIADKLRYLDDRFSELPEVTKADSLSIMLLPQKLHWNVMIKNALQSISEEVFRKIVLARKKILTQSGIWNPAKLLKAISGIEENSFTFFYQLDDDIAFLGRSPERLISIRNGRILAEAIAGTRPRGKNDFDDQRLEAELLDSRKEREEHRFVSGFIESKMRRYCNEVRIESAEEILKLKNVQHIISRYTGLTGGQTHPLEIARSFHPTPAVGGYPQENILGHIRQSERFCRGWYAAPIGWIDKANADFAVGIRSALVHGNQLHLFAGAGIVGKSNAQAEWAETEKKMNNFKMILRKY
jgi:menaquinone-specific isochorismate synthase